MRAPYNDGAGTVRARLLERLMQEGVLDGPLDDRACAGPLDRLESLDSMGQVQALALIEEEFRVVIPGEMLLAELTSIDRIAAHVAALRLGEAA